MIDDGTLSAGSISFGAGGVGVAKGTLTAAGFTIAAGRAARRRGDGLAEPGGGACADLRWMAPSKGAVAIYPDMLAGPVGGTGTLLVDAGGAIEAASPRSAPASPRVSRREQVRSTSTPGGNAGGILSIDDPAHFAGTIFGFAPGDQIEVPASLDVIGATLLAGNHLALLGTGGPIATLALDPAADFSPFDFTTGAAGAPAGSITGITPPAATAIGLASAGAPLAPLLSLPGPFRTVAGATGVIPVLSVLDAAAIAAAGTVTVTLGVTSGTLPELISLPDEFAFGTAITQTGLNTGTLAITSTSIFRCLTVAAFARRDTSPAPWRATIPSRSA